MILAMSKSSNFFSLIIIFLTLNQVIGGFLGFGKKENSQDVVVVSASGAAPVIYQGEKGLNIVMSSGDQSSSQSETDQVSQAAASPESSSEPSKLLGSSNAITRRFTDLVASESKSSASLTTPEIFSKLMRIPASKFDKIADKLIEEAFNGGVLAPPPASFNKGQSVSSSNINVQRVPFIPAVQTRQGIVPGFMSPFMTVMRPLATSSSSPAPVPIATIRLPVYVPDEEALEDVYDEKRLFHQQSQNHKSKQRQSSSSPIFDESKIPPPVEDKQPQYEKSSSESNFEHSTNQNDQDQIPPSPSAHSEQPYHERLRDDQNRDEPEVIHTYVRNTNGVNQRPQLTSASNVYPLLPSFTQSLPFQNYPIPITSLNGLAPNPMAMYASANQPFVHSSSHPLTHLNKVIHGGFLSDIRKIPQPFSYNYNYGLDRQTQGLKSNLLKSSRASSSIFKPLSSLASASSLFPSFRPLFASHSMVKPVKIEPPMISPRSKPSTINQAIPHSSIPVAVKTATKVTKTYPILDTSSAVPKIYNAPHNPVEILTIFADAYGKQPPQVSSPKINTSNKSISTLKSIFSKPFLSDRIGSIKSTKDVDSEPTQSVSLPIFVREGN